MDIADEIVVVDSFSTDATSQICAEFNCKFIQHPFEGHIQQKNYALDQALHPHVLSLDADEALSPELKESIQSIKNDWEYDAYYFNRLSSYCGQFIRYGSWYPDKKVRLFNKNFGSWGGVNPHDKVVLSTEKVHFLKGDLLHYTYNTISEHGSQINYFSSIAAKAAYESGKRFSILKLISKPLWRFFRDYFLKRGFMAGYRGLTICFLSAAETYLKIIKLWELQKMKENSPKKINQDLAK
ncbi:glycosyl transferase [Marivirga lumbricoides]|uniref:Glycosyl transferase n=2 Tax=Marivirga lumbricoides TaxID=1046115 RepID=A0ABQ1LPL4_9BACT|nr:glycosyl transferase [Marivirga lumbricoides]